MKEVENLLEGVKWNNIGHSTIRVDSKDYKVREELVCVKWSERGERMG